MKMARMIRLIRSAVVLTIAPSLVVAITCGALPSFSPTVLTAEEKLEAVHIEVDDMASKEDAAAIESNLTKLPEVKESNIDWKSGTVDLKVTEGSDHNALFEAIEAAGFSIVDFTCECGG